MVNYNIWKNSSEIWAIHYKHPCFKCNSTKIEFRGITGVLTIQIIRLKQKNKVFGSSS